MSLSPMQVFQAGGTGRAFAEGVLPFVSLDVLTHTCFLVIVRRVVAARRAHANGTAMGTPQKANGLFSHGHSALRTQPLTPLGDKGGDMTDFPQRPGAKKTKRGGFWARFKCW